MEWVGGMAVVVAIMFLGIVLITGVEIGVFIADFRREDKNETDSESE